VAATVVRWRRYGKDRLYVADEDGTKLGYRDLATGQDHLDAPQRLAEFAAAVSGWAETTGPQAGTSPEDPRSPERDAAVPHPDSPPTQQAQTPAPPSGPVDRKLSPDDQASGAEGPLEAESTDADAWEDLAQRTAGAMARAQAQELREAAPVRTLLARVLGVHTDERAWRIGADGEEKVAARLARLSRKDPRWRFLHAIPVGKRGSDIDHLVIGPGGVFTLNAKHHPHGKIWVAGDMFMVNGRRHPYIRNSRHEAARASQLLTGACGFRVHVTPVVVPVSADDLTIKTPPADVEVVNRMRLTTWLRQLPQALTDDQVDTVYEAARRSTTWQG
jgi:hypothetical protein